MIKNFLIVVVLGVIMIGAVVYGISESGSPWDSRSKKFDQTRVTDLNNIHYAIDDYYYSHKVLPENLDQAKGSSSASYYSFKDPETSQPYEYKTTSTTSYQLCANFSLPSDQKSDNLILPAINSVSSTHPKGHFCYDLTAGTANSPLLQATPYPSPTPSLAGTPLAKCTLTASASATPSAKLQILGIYETDKNVVFTTNKIANASIERWTGDPKSASGFYYYGSDLFDSQTNGSSFDKATGYRVKVFNPTGETTTSADYIFQGNRTVIADPRCK